MFGADKFPMAPQLKEKSVSDTPKSPEQRLGRDLVKKRRTLEGSPQGFGDGRKWIPFQMMDPAMRLIRRALSMTGAYKPLTRKVTRIHVVENAVFLRDVGRSLSGLRILHLSDIHIDGAPGLGERLAAKCAELQFDLAVITGDLRLEIRGEFETVMNEMRPLMSVLRQCPLGVFGVLGNHDEISMVKPLEDMGMQYLLNESTHVDVGGEKLHIAGVDDAHFFGTDDIDEALGNVPVNEPCLFLCHSPDLIYEAAALECDFYLCGHTHGGQICLPGGNPVFSNASVSRRFCTGSWILNGMRGYTSRGIGFSGIPFRSYCNAELIVHTINPERRDIKRIQEEEIAEEELYHDDK
ncbi:MAG: putative MPP superfamily phosphohydrolase [Planctomycetota bacterium]|jgi:predicted MPP superfamily phosphohydrolase